MLVNELKYKLINLLNELEDMDEDDELTMSLNDGEMTDITFDIVDDSHISIVSFYED